MGRLIIVLFGLLLSALADRASAEPFTTIRNNGDPANRVDIVILGDGYTAAELGKYEANVNALLNGLFVQEPFREYERYFNVHRVDVTSNQSGADHPELGVFRDTALDATYNCFGIPRLLCVDNSKVTDVLARSIAPDQREVVIVLVNDLEYGGSGGAIAVASIHPEVIELVLHELGHSFGLLADEYDSSPPFCDTSLEPFEPNVTKQTNRSSIKWNTGGGPPTGWIEFATRIPTTDASPGIVGLYDGAKYCTSGLFRPTFDSKMRNLNRPFEQVNSEQLVKRIYNWVSPIDASEPLAATVILPSGGSQEFSVQLPSPLTGTFEITWKLDGQTVRTGTQYLYSSAGLPSGSQNLEVMVQDLTRLVRADPASVLIETRVWTVITESSPLGPDTLITSSPAALSTIANATFVFESTIPGSKFTCSLDGASFSACRSPKRYSRLPNGGHTFLVRAIDPQGNLEPTPATHSWTIDTTRPETTITAKPPAMTKSADAGFEFASNEGNSTFRCKLDGGAFAPCASPQTYTGLTAGKHSFQVAAIDLAGNSGKKAALHKWTVDTTAPETTIRTKPPALTRSTEATFTFSANERASTFDCSLDGGVFEPCTKRRVFLGLAPGLHSFQVQATDPAGNVDPTPASYSWTIQ
jgi:hypothetical protein